MMRSTNAIHVRVILAMGFYACSSGTDGSGSDASTGMVNGGSSGSAGSTAGTTSAAGTSGAAAGVTGGAGSAGEMGGAGGMGNAGSAGSDAPALEHFSFFVTSLRAMQELSQNQNGFGGDLRYGETGDGAGLRGADKICTEIAEQSMPGSGAKGWRAFLSAVAAGDGGAPVHAKDRVGTGPWYDRLGRLVANNLDELIQVRPSTADAAIIDDLPNEDGVPNHNPDGAGEVDNHDILTGSNDSGEVYAMDMHVTCNDWANSVADSADAPRVGHSWPRGRFGGGGGMFPGGGMLPGGGSINGEHWISALDEAGCGAGVSIVEMGPPNDNNPTVGSGGGYGGIYCFALQP
jgi:hypothetical protein